MAIWGAELSLSLSVAGNRYLGKIVQDTRHVLSTIFLPW